MIIQPQTSQRFISSYRQHGTARPLLLYPPLQACEDYYCVDPCLSGTCKATDFCRVMNHRPICGFNYEAPPQVAGTRDT